jgi:hypothetical protein
VAVGFVFVSRDGFEFEERFLVNNVRVKTKRLSRTSQGDVFREIECIEYVFEKQAIIEVSKTIFPLVVVLTQDCDLEQDARYRGRQQKVPNNQDKKLFSVLVAPLYNAEHVFSGEHLAELGLTMSPINKRATEGKHLMQNGRPRYHYLDFPANIQIVPSIADFKHYFSVSITYLDKIRPKNFVCRLSELFREDLSQRFAAYLARIGLPTLTDVEKTTD